jgi:hypothetical protein
MARGPVDSDATGRARPPGWARASLGEWLGWIVVLAIPLAWYVPLLRGPFGFLGDPRDRARLLLSILWPSGLVVLAATSAIYWMYLVPLARFFRRLRER